MNDIKPTIRFCCPPELEAKLPRPIPAVEGLPGWFKSMPVKAFSELAQGDLLTVKKCPPFIDAMTCGFLIPLAIDVRVDNGEFSWAWEFRSARCPALRIRRLTFTTTAKSRDRPFSRTIASCSSSTLSGRSNCRPAIPSSITHPFNRADLPFVTLTGLVDADRYHQLPQFPGALAR